MNRNEKLLIFTPFSERELFEITSMMPYALSELVTEIFYLGFREERNTGFIESKYKEWQKFLEESDCSVNMILNYSKIMEEIRKYYNGVVKFKYTAIRGRKCKLIEFILGFENGCTFDCDVMALRKDIQEIKQRIDI